MKRLLVITSVFVLAVLCAGAQVTVSTAVEPALNAPARFGVSAAASVPIPYFNLSMRYGSGNTLMPGLSRNFVEFWPGAELVGDIQGGVMRDRGNARGVILYGAGVATDLGEGFGVTYGLHINKIAGRPIFPSAYVSLGYTFR